MSLNYVCRPRDYQAEALEALRHFYWKEQQNRLAGIMATGMGKGQPLSARIKTPNGETRMGRLKVGDSVIGAAGTPVTVTGIFDRGILPTFRVTFNDGTSVIVDGDHLWAVRSRSQKHRDRGYRIVQTRDIVGWDLEDLYVPVVEPVQHTEKDLPLDPYALGVLLGDGGMTGDSVMLSSADPFILDEFIRRTGYRLTYSSQYDYRIDSPMMGRGKELQTILRGLGLYGSNSFTKFIPAEYMFGSVEQRLDLLRGLMDTDGWRQDGAQSGFFSTVSGRLANQVAELVRSLGGVTRVRLKRTNGGCGAAYNVTVNTPDCPFLLPRKAAGWQRENRSRVRKIVSVLPAGEEAIRCISVDAPDSLYVTENYTVTHNTSGVAANLPLTFPELSEHRNGEGGVLFIVHRIEIIRQAYEKFAALYPDKWIGLEQAENHCTGYEDFIFASVDSLGRLMSERIWRYSERKFGMIVVDEAHHVRIDNTWDNILTYFGVGSRPDTHFKLSNGLRPLAVYLTATPQPNMRPFLDMCDTQTGAAFNYDIIYGIRNGWLVDIRAWKAAPKDFSMRDLVDADGRPLPEQVDYLVKVYDEFAKGMKTLCFARSVEQSKMLANTLNEMGLARAGHVDALTPKEEREEILRAYAADDLDFLSNRLVFTEGWDSPGIQCIIDNAPTESRTLAIQKWGRGLRPAPDAHVDNYATAAERIEAIKRSSKDALHLITTYDPIQENSLTVVAALWGRDIEEEDGAMIVEEIVDRIESAEKEHPERPLREIKSLHELEVELQRWDVWSMTIENDKLKAVTPLRWVVGGYEGNESVSLYLPANPRARKLEEKTPVIWRFQRDGAGWRFIEIIVGGWVEYPPDYAEKKRRRGKRQDGFVARAQVRVGKIKNGLNKAIRNLDRYLLEVAPDLYAEMKRGASGPATDAQKRYMRGHGIRFGDGVTEETASVLIDEYRIRTKIEKMDLDLRSSSQNVRRTA